MTAPTPQVAVVSGSSDLSSPEFIDELLAAHTAGIEIELYLSARAAGIDDNELFTAEAKNFPLPEYVACRAQGATPAQLIRLAGRIKPNNGQYRAMVATLFCDYHQAVSYGTTHTQFTNVLNCATPVHQYIHCRAAGATHAEVTKYAYDGGYLSGYAQARAEGWAHVELLEAHHASIPAIFYADARALGVTHAELLEAATHSFDLFNYVKERKDGHDHTKAIRLATHLATPA